MNNKLEEIYRQIREEMDKFICEESRRRAGVKVAAREARKHSNNLGKLLKEYRAASLEEEKE